LNKKGVVVKKYIFLSLLVIAVIFSITAQEGTFPTIAVMDVAATNTSDVKSQVIYEYIVDVVNRANLYTIVERAALQAAIKEMEISASGMVDDTTAAEIGKLAGAELILISNLIVDDGITYLSARIVSVETGQVNNTAMLQIQEDEYIASLANRTISQLLGVDAGKTVTETAAVEENTKDEPSKEDDKSVSDPALENEGSEKNSKMSLTIAGAGILPFSDYGDLFQIGYGLNVDLDFKLLMMGKSSLSMGAGSGVFFDASKNEGDVIYPFNLISIPLALNLKYKMVMGSLFITVKVGGGGAVNMFMYREDTPAGVESTLISLNPAIFPGLSVGYMLSDKLGLALFGDWSMIFFQERPYTAVNAGLAVTIEL
jgi:hypothetical protein